VDQRPLFAVNTLDVATAGDSDDDSDSNLNAITSGHTSSDMTLHRQPTALSSIYLQSAAALQQFGSAVSMEVDRIGSSAAMESYTKEDSVGSVEHIDAQDHSEEVDGGEVMMTLGDLPSDDEMPGNAELNQHFSEGPKSTIGADDNINLLSASSIQHFENIYSDFE